VTTITAERRPTAAEAGAYVTRLLNGLGEVAESRRSLAADQRSRAIVARLLSKRLRKSPLNDVVRHRVEGAVTAAMREDRPIRLLIPFGGYKAPRSPEYPHPGWAELFSVTAMVALAMDVATLWPAGVVVEYRSDAAVIVPRLTGLAETTLESYARRFDRVLGTVRGFAASNVALLQTSSASFHDVDALLGEVTTLARALDQWWFPALPPAERQRLLRRAAHNRAFPTEDANVLRLAVCEHEAYLRLDERLRTRRVDDDCTIPIAQRRGISGWLHLGSNRCSDTQFWIGFGVLDLRGRRPVDRIVGPSGSVIAGAARITVDVEDHAARHAGLGRLPVLVS
jgi:hypothetical protein